MFASLKLYAFAAALAVLAGGGWYLHHRIDAEGFARGQIEGTKRAQAAQAKQAQAELAEGQCAVALNVTTAMTKAAQDAATAQAAAAADAVKSAQAKAVDSDRTLKAWMAKYATTTRNPDCAKTLQEQLCAAVSGF